YMWCQMVQAAQEKIAAGEGDQAFYESKIKTAQFFMARVLPEGDARFKMVMAGADTLMNLDEAAF
ncbi:MAG: acyl-CoA dehydrogenase C-terminal domain-containing protein, partial [Alphaproteobacteria bacterium]